MNKKMERLFSLHLNVCHILQVKTQRFFFFGNGYVVERNDFWIVFHHWIGSIRFAIVCGTKEGVEVNNIKDWAKQRVNVRQ